MPSSVKAIARFLTMMQTANIDYAENFNSRLPGFMTGVQFVDKSFTGLSPNIDYMFGRQPDTAWLNGQEKKGNLTKDPAFNMLFRQQAANPSTYDPVALQAAKDARKAAVAAAEATAKTAEAALVKPTKPAKPVKAAKPTASPTAAPKA